LPSPVRDSTRPTVEGGSRSRSAISGPVSRRVVTFGLVEP
jgi:hypothetical protein